MRRSELDNASYFLFKTFQKPAQKLSFFPMRRSELDNA
jgi:hypothetical protein